MSALARVSVFNPLFSAVGHPAQSPEVAEAKHKLSVKAENRVEDARETDSPGLSSAKLHAQKVGETSSINVEKAVQAPRSLARSSHDSLARGHMQQLIVEYASKQSELERTPLEDSSAKANTENNPTIKEHATDEQQSKYDGLVRAEVHAREKAGQRSFLGSFNFVS
ncbi:MAG: hypothetical protein COV44_01120 [Deltaproteobacteria bacterium CG11_big_fil_rev_8_21_14_0_20_45_16]|nr:MAG: hypothetical protein COV44_01120 [Deltaproteobacteria bacterium CG11_big_fil_rev_8_21_14_0_20_45_16]